MSALDLIRTALATTEPTQALWWSRPFVSVFGPAAVREGNKKSKDNTSTSAYIPGFLVTSRNFNWDHVPGKDRIDVSIEHLGSGNCFHSAENYTNEKELAAYLRKLKTVLEEWHAASEPFQNSLEAMRTALDKFSGLLSRSYSSGNAGYFRDSRQLEDLVRLSTAERD